jgi:signal transduction histidine kinase
VACGLRHRDRGRASSASQDDKTPLDSAGRDWFRNFAGEIDTAAAALSKGGEFQGIRCRPVPVELRELFDEIERRWKPVQPALLRVAASTDIEEAAARRRLHSVFPNWQSDVGRMQRSLVRREGTIRAQMANTFALIGAVNAAFLALVILLVRRYITGPVQVVQAAASRIAAGDYSIAVPVSGNDEISACAAEFNRMSAQLQATVGALRESEHALAAKAQALEKSNRELEQYAYAAAHDLQEPVRILSLYSQMLRRKCQLPPDAGQFTSQIEANAERMLRLVKDLLVHSRSVHEPARSAPLDPNTALAEALAHLDDAISSARAVIRYESLPMVLADGPDLEVVFRNLIGNALKYRAEAAPEVDITATVSGGRCTIRVRDNGIGIAPEYHERVFGLFKRLHGREVPGTGVGLAVTKNLVEKHGGRIWVESESGRGATFVVELAATASATAIAS